MQTYLRRAVLTLLVNRQKVLKATTANQHFAKMQTFLQRAVLTLLVNRQKVQKATTANQHFC